MKRRLAREQNFNAAFAALKQELLNEKQLLESRYNRGLRWASLFSQGAADNFEKDPGTRRLCARVLEISEELISL